MNTNFRKGDFKMKKVKQEQMKQDRVILWMEDLNLMLGRSKSTIERMIKSGRMPSPDFYLNGRRAWKPKTILEWVDAGCPAMSFDSHENRITACYG